MKRLSVEFRCGIWILFLALIFPGAVAASESGKGPLGEDFSELPVIFSIYDYEVENNIAGTSDEFPQDRELIKIVDLYAAVNDHGKLEVTGYINNGTMSTLKQAKVYIECHIGRFTVHREIVLISHVLPYCREFFGVTINQDEFDVIKYKITDINLEY